MSGVVTGTSRRYIAPLGGLAAAAAIALYISSSRSRQAEQEFRREADVHKKHSENDDPVKQRIRERLRGERDTQEGKGIIKLPS